MEHQCPLGAADLPVEFGMESKSLGEIALVTGGASGIGYHLARRLAREGMRVVIVSRSQDRLDTAANALREETGGDIVPIACDVADRQQVRSLADRIKREIGDVDVLCINAGVTTAGEYRHHSEEDWDWAIGINLGGPVNFIQAFYPAMAERGSGSILVTGSQTTLVPDWVSDHGPYLPAKAALLALVFALRVEAEKYGVNVSMIMPAATETAMVTPEGSRQVSEGATIQPRAGLPDPQPPFFLHPDEVAARAISGLKERAPLIVSHAGMKPLVADYFARVLAAYDAAAAWHPEPGDEPAKPSFMATAPE